VTRPTPAELSILLERLTSTAWLVPPYAAGNVGSMTRREALLEMACALGVTVQSLGIRIRNGKRAQEQTRIAEE
jgi:hypothetical protein